MVGIIQLKRWRHQSQKLHPKPGMYIVFTHKQKEKKAKMLDVPKHSPFRKKYSDIYTSFARRRSAAVHKLLTDKPTTAIAILKHVWDQEYKIPAKHVLMNKYWKRSDGSLGALLIEMGKHKATKDSKKLSASVNKIKQKYDSLRQASRLANIPWTKFHRSTFVQKKIDSKGKFTHKLSSKEVSDIQSHFESDDNTFPLPDKKFEGKRFMRQSVKKSLRMYNDLATTSRKISLSTYYRYKPKNVKFQGKIPF